MTGEEDSPQPGLKQDRARVVLANGPVRNRTQQQPVGRQSVGEGQLHGLPDSTAHLMGIAEPQQGKLLIMEAKS